MKIHNTLTGPIYHARAEEVYPLLPDAVCAMAHVDGPYAMGKAAWDRQGISGLVEWYEPHVEEWSRILTPSASIYHWGTAESEGEVRALYRRYGWTFRGLIIWDKGLGSIAGKIDTEAMRMWPDVTEVCGFYQREGFDISAMARGEVYRDLDAQRCAIEAARFLTSERERAGMSRRELSVFFPSRTGGLTGCVTNWEEGFNFPTWDIWRRLHEALNTQTGGPYLQRDRSKLYDAEALRSEYEALRSEYKVLRAPFTLPIGITNIWRENAVQGGQRLAGADGQALHPCQKPLALVRRAILASTRPSDTVLVPFGGTCREAVVCEGLHGTAEARRHITIEMVEDGRDYLGAVMAQIANMERRQKSFDPVVDLTGQVAMFR